MVEELHEGADRDGRTSELIVSPRKGGPFDDMGLAGLPRESHCHKPPGKIAVDPAFLAYRRIGSRPMVSKPSGATGTCSTACCFEAKM